LECVTDKYFLFVLETNLYPFSPHTIPKHFEINYHIRNAEVNDSDRGKGVDMMKKVLLEVGIIG